ncbi:hypothetical protein C7U60_20190 [Mesorhizobium plurifarium]|uniref:hypothetical protein n=1 Tax=Sinorhizobium arboris TaxID=76745 RepID=UPI00040F9F3E|nr:hypothetical protein [Sinorhizobium arboris]PST17390.1 hypothetical protein C7U60_20190 [Mesorhizobium plurifarium]
MMKGRGRRQVLEEFKKKLFGSSSQQSGITGLIVTVSRARAYRGNRVTGKIDYETQDFKVKWVMKP